MAKNRLKSGKQRSLESGGEFNFYQLRYITGVMDFKTMHWLGHQSPNYCLGQPQLNNASLTFEPQKIELCGKSQQIRWRDLPTAVNEHPDPLDQPQGLTTRVVARYVVGKGQLFEENRVKARPTPLPPLAKQKSKNILMSANEMTKPRGSAVARGGALKTMLITCKLKEIKVSQQQRPGCPMSKALLVTPPSPLKELPLGQERHEQGWAWRIFALSYQKSGAPPRAYCF